MSERFDFMKIFTFVSFEMRVLENVHVQISTTSVMQWSHPGGGGGGGGITRYFTGYAPMSKKSIKRVCFSDVRCQCFSLTLS